MTRRKDGIWQEKITFIENGKPKVKYFYGKKKVDVLRKIAAFNDNRKEGEKFKSIANEWWNEKEPKWAPSTIGPYKAAYERAVEAFGDKDISTIKAPEITSYMKIFERERCAKRKTLNTQLSIIRQILSYAVERGYIETNPAREVSIGRTQKRDIRNPASKEDIQRIKDSIDLPFGMFAYMALYTGMRRGELLALEWEDIDFERKQIHVTKSLSYIGSSVFAKEPKTQAGHRVIPLLRKLEDHLNPGKGIIFNRNGRYLTNGEFQVLWKHYTKDSGILCTPHQLRHTFATVLFENDISVKDAQEILGHAQASTTQDIYTHIREERIKKISDRLLSVEID